MANKEKNEVYEPWIPQAPISTLYPFAYNLILIDSIDKLKKVLSQSFNVIAFDTETTSLNTDEAELVGYSFCYDGKNAYYVPVNHAPYLDESKSALGIEEYIDASLGEEALEIFYKALEIPKYILTFNQRYDVRVVERFDSVGNYTETRYFHKYDMSRYFKKLVDVQAIVFDSDTNMPYPNLKSCEEKYLGWRGASFKETLGDSETFYYLKPSECYQYAATDALGTFLLGEKMWYYYAVEPAERTRYPKSKFPNILNSGELDTQFLYPLMLMEDEFTKIDVDLMKSYSDYYEKEINKTKDEINMFAGRPINAISPKQKSEIFKEKGIIIYDHDGSIALNKRGEMKSDKEHLQLVIDRLKEGDPSRAFMENLIKLANLTKQKGTYADNFIDFCDPKKNKNCTDTDHKLRFGYKTMVVPSGRLAAGGDKKNSYFANANIQNIPKPKTTMCYYVNYNDLIKIKPEFTDVYENPRCEFYYNGEKTYKILDWVFKESIWNIEGLHEMKIEGFKQKLNIRSGFTSDDDKYWVSCDFSAQELRVPALLTREPLWTHTFENNGDLHEVMAKKIWGEENYDKQKRKMAKKCYSINSRFLTSKGYVTYDRLSNNNLLDLNLNPQLSAYFLDILPGYEIEFENGQIIEVTEGHKFLMTDVFKENTWEKIENLTIGREIALSTEVPNNILVAIDNFTGLPLNNSLAYICGLYLGDGCLNIDANYLEIVVKEDNKDYVYNTLSDYGNTYFTREKNTYNVIRCYSKKLVRFISTNFGFKKEKYIGDIIYESPKEVILNFLAGLLDSDGKICRVSVEFQNTNEKMVRDASFLFTYLGYKVLSFKTYTARLQAKYRKINEDYYCPYFTINIAFEEKIKEIPLRIQRSIDFINTRKNSFIGYYMLDSERDYFKAYKLEKLENFIYRKTRLSRNLSKEIGDWRCKYNSSRIIRITKKNVEAVCLECETHHFVADNIISKNCNFGLLYGMTAKNFAIDFNMSLERAEDLVKNYKASAPVLFNWVHYNEQLTKTTGVTSTMFGRPRRLGWYLSNDRSWGMQNFGLRSCTNTVIQGTGADILKMSFLNIYNLFYKTQEMRLANRKYIKFINTVHDEINYNVSKEHIKFIVPKIISCMRLWFDDWDFPMQVGLDIGTRWGQTIAFKYDTRPYIEISPDTPINEPRYRKVSDDEANKCNLHGLKKYIEDPNGNFIKNKNYLNILEPDGEELSEKDYQVKEEPKKEVIEIEEPEFTFDSLYDEII